PLAAASPSSSTARFNVRARSRRTGGCWTTATRLPGPLAAFFGMADNLAALAEWLLVDGSSLIFRAFFGVPKTFHSPDGRLVNAVRGFSDRLANLVQERRPKRLVVTTDEDWRPQFRVELIPSYKAHRVAEPIPPELEPQMPLIMDYLAAAGVDAVGVPGFEAEDVIASLASRIDGSIDIVSGDRDLFALVRDPDVRVLYPE